MERSGIQESLHSVTSDTGISTLLSENRYDDIEKKTVIPVLGERRESKYRNLNLHATAYLLHHQTNPSTQDLAHL